MWFLPLLQSCPHNSSFQKHISKLAKRGDKKRYLTKLKGREEGETQKEKQVGPVFQTFQGQGHRNEHDYVGYAMCTVMRSLNAIAENAVRDITIKYYTFSTGKKNVKVKVIKTSMVMYAVLVYRHAQFQCHSVNVRDITTKKVLYTSKYYRFSTR